MSAYQKASHIDFLPSVMCLLKSITLYAQIHQFCDNQSQILLLRLVIFSRKSPKKMLDLLKDIHNSPLFLGSMFFQVWKTYAGQRWRRMTKQTYNQDWIRRHGCKSYCFFEWLSPKLKKLWKEFFEDPETFLWKIFLSLKEDYIGMFIS